MTQQGDGGNIFKSEAQELIMRLKLEQGWSYAKIGEALGRDRSLISQAARGAKPIRNAVPALRSLLANETTGPGGPATPTTTTLSSTAITGTTSPQLTPAPSVPRRVGKGGVANVRGGLIFEKEGGAHIQTKRQDFLLKQIQQAAEKNQWVQITTRYDKVSWKDGVKEKHRNINIYKKGYSAEAMLRRVDELVATAKVNGQVLRASQALAALLRQDTFKAVLQGGKSAGLGEAGKVEQYEAEVSDEQPW